MRTRRASASASRGQERLIAAEDAGRYRDATGAMPPPGLPDVFIEPVPRALHGLVRRYARTHGPFAVGDVAQRWGVPVQRVLDELAELERDDTVLRMAGDHWCDAEVLRRIRRVTLAGLRREVEAVPGEALARFLPRWQRVDEGGRAGPERLRDAIATLQALPLPVAVMEPEVLPRRVPGYRQDLLDGCAPRARSCGGAPGATAGSRSPSAPTRRCSARRPAPPSPAAWRARRRPARAARRGAPLLRATSPRPSRRRAAEVLAALWDLVWAGEVTNDAYAPLRAPRTLPAVRQVRDRTAPDPRGGGAPPPASAGRWTPHGAAFEGASEADRARARAEVVLERHGIVTRSGVRAEGQPGGYGAVYGELGALETIGACPARLLRGGPRRGAVRRPGALERLRDLREPTDEPRRSCWRPPTRPTPTARPWRGRSAPAGRASRTAGRRGGAGDGQAVLFLERGGRSLLPLVAPDDPAIEPALAALVAAAARACRAASAWSASTARTPSPAPGPTASSRRASAAGRAGCTPTVTRARAASSSRAGVGD